MNPAFNSKLDFNEVKKLLTPHVKTFNNGLLKNYGLEPVDYVWAPKTARVKSLYSAKKVYALLDRLKRKEFKWQK